MSDTQYEELGGTVFFHFAANDTSGSGGDGASAACHIRLCGAAGSAAPVYSPTPTLLSNASYPAGAYEVQVDCTTGNGFADQSTYAAFCTLAIDSQNPTGFIGRVALGKLATQADLGVLLETTVATLASQTSFTLTAGSDQDDQYNNLLMVVEDADSITRRERVYASNYTGSSRTVTLAAATTTFTLAVGDKVLIYPVLHESQLASATAAAAIEADTQDIQSRLPDALSPAGNMKSNIEEINDVTVTGSGVEDTDEWRPA